MFADLLSILDAARNVAAMFARLRRARARPAAAPAKATAR